MKWPTTTIGRVCLPTKSIDPRGARIPVFRYIDISSIDRKTKSIIKTSKILGADAPSRARKVVRYEDILVSTVRPNLNAVAIVPDWLDGEIASTGFCILRPDQQRILPQFLFYFTQTPGFVTHLTTRVRGAHYPAVSECDVLNVRIPLPPISEQRRIVEILDQADRLRKLRAEADAKVGRILPALFIKMFGDPATNPKGMEIVSFGSLISRGPQNGIYKPASAYGSGTRILRIDGFYDGRIKDISSLKRLKISDAEVERYRLRESDIVINRVNSEEYLGKSAIVPPLDEPVVFESNMMRLSVDTSQVDPKYVIAHLQIPYIRREILRRAKRAINQASINQKDVASLRLLRPPLSMQERFVSMAGIAWDFVDQIAETKSRLDHLFAALLHRAFTGDLTASWREGHMRELLEEMENQKNSLAEVR